MSMIETIIQIFDLYKSGYNFSSNDEPARLGIGLVAFTEINGEETKLSKIFNMRNIYVSIEEFQQIKDINEFDRLCNDFKNNLSTNENFLYGNEPHRFLYILTDKWAFLESDAYKNALSIYNSNLEIFA